MRRPVRTTLATGLVAGVAAVSTMMSMPATAAPQSAPVQAFLAHQLDGLGSTGLTTVLVHGSSLSAADAAVKASGLTRTMSFDRIGVVVARGTKAQIQKAGAQPGVTYLEGNQPIKLLGTTSNQATRGDEAFTSLTGADGSSLSGKGVSVGLIDSGVDPTHPYLTEQDGSSVVVSNNKVACDPFEAACQVVNVPTSVDTDTLSAGGHGTHVAGIIAGRPTTLSSGAKIHGAAPGAKLVSLSTGAALVILGSDTALNWVLEHHSAPCGAGVSASVCPPIKVTNNSYGPTGGGEFDPQSATVELQRALAADGVVTAWANGNDGGDGSQNLSNPPGQDPTGGIISVASYNDNGTGTRDGEVSDFSSRGQSGRPSTYPDISAPGELITSSCRPYLLICSTGLDPQNGPGPTDVGTFNTISGTSMATPHIAGIVAQLFQRSPGATPAQVEDAIKSTAYKYTNGAPYDANGTSYDKGYGLVDVVAAAKALAP